MTDSTRVKKEPQTLMNQWAKEAIEHSGMTMQAVADALSARRELGAYGRSMVQKMTKERRVRLDEAAALSEITGFPLPGESKGPELVEQIQDLNPENRAIIGSLVAQLLAAQEAKK
ncbi:hypothetical protein SAMN04489859_102039 [Paracoccus alcaliphilus]|uniref:Uncharacterized protein n=1 Tax=Paracoccus alcaliphilus TaxID=34002 RepID=A0A1H8K430_9RHOB|nr:hypothetical protein [Paracoccus alcaliphilus]WCR17535.1 hypothetical protein JHW40_14535 [Paracoccus alcaliphilus]SEN87585.1 hypothetical protein SAMN04489859_102039 [Paracoccus alcaliphilus]